MDFVRLDRADTVVTATRSLSPGSDIERIVTRATIPSGHKVATQAMAMGGACKGCHDQFRAESK